MKVIEFLKNAKVYYAATEDGGQPHVRPIGFVMADWRFIPTKERICTNSL